MVEGLSLDWSGVCGMCGMCVACTSCSKSSHIVSCAASMARIIHLGMNLRGGQHMAGVNVGRAGARRSEDVAQLEYSSRQQPLVASCCGATKAAL